MNSGTVLERCDLVWGEDGSPLYLNDDFEQRIQMEAVRRASFTTADTDSFVTQKNTKIFSWKSSKSVPDTCTMESCYSNNTMKSTYTSSLVSSGGTKSYIARSFKHSEDEPADPPLKVSHMERAKKQLRRSSRNLTEAGKKIVGIPGVIIFDLLGGMLRK